jgi:hypothetical protein
MKATADRDKRNFFISNFLDEQIGLAHRTAQWPIHSTCENSGVHAAAKELCRSNASSTLQNRWERFRLWLRITKTNLGLYPIDIRRIPKP